MGNDATKEILFDLLKSLLELRKVINEKATEKEDPHSHEERKLIVEIKNDFHRFFKWALDMGENDGIPHNEIAPTWRRLHPDLPVPRIALIREDCDSGFLLFLMDAYPLYLKHREKE